MGDVEHGRYVVLEGHAFGGDRVYRYEWPGTDLEGPGPHRIQLWDRYVPDLPTGALGSTPGNSSITLIVHDGDHTIPDTATVGNFSVLLQIQAPRTVGWAGVAWGGVMVNNPLTVGWANGNTAVVSSRSTTRYSKTPVASPLALHAARPRACDPKLLLRA